MQASLPLRAGALAVLARILLAVGGGASGQRAQGAREAHTLVDSLDTIEEGEVMVRLVYAEALAASSHTVTAPSQ